MHQFENVLVLAQGHAKVQYSRNPQDFRPGRASKRAAPATIVWLWFSPYQRPNFVRQAQARAQPPPSPQQETTSWWMTSWSNVLKSTSTPHVTKKSSGFRQKLSSLLKSPASERYNKVFADAQDQRAASDPASKFINHKTANMTVKEKAKAEVEKRKAESVSGNLVFGGGPYTSLSTSQGYEAYYAGKIFD
ncbi:hypothetical protein AJ80_07510 [Polytolypa hystricis UAMH7299]|uniref:Uncharacterized protein n=1 Tax=Polytolypa hystricis (strain UAMH7299) TaxID=1447883 RepID=A0A2B7XPM1_POLH7|nr:hypothetical protein AJ80_07510 [Polytolypa hystricis UAMH7299]